MLVLGAGAGAVSWLCAWWRQVAGAGGGCARGGNRVPGAGCWVYSELVPASDSEVITTAASDSEG